MPVKTISLYPLLTRLVTSSIASSKSLLRSPPLAYGIAQYAQKALQPSCIFTNALV